MTGQLHIFTGPTISAKAIKSRLPEAVIHEPIKHGDLIRLGAADGDTIAIVDGYFYQQAPLRHKEILGCIDAGARVVGASSIGALRAAELHPFGMEGVGAIYRIYRRGLVDGDDEVALVHASADHGYAPTTLPMVNIRASCARARRAGTITLSEQQLVLKTAGQMPFHRRTWHDIALRMESRLGARAEDICHQCRASYRDLKLADALLLLERLQSPATPTTHGRRVQPRTRFVEEWDYWQRFHGEPDGDPVRDIDLLSLVQSMAPGFAEVYHRIMLENYVGETKYATAQLALLETAAWELTQNRGTFAQTLPVAVENDWLRKAERELTLTQRAARVIVRSHRAAGTLPLRAPLMRYVRATYDLVELAASVRQARRFNAALRRRDEKHSVQHLSQRAVTEFWLGRWNETELMPALTARGFASAGDLYACTRQFMLAAKFASLAVPAP